MNILIVSTAFNGLTQRVWSELRRAGHFVTQRVLPSEDDAAVREWVAQLGPELVIAPFLKAKIPVDLGVPTVIIHPGLPGDAGPSAIDWAIHRNERQWGAEAIDAHEIIDGGAVHAWAAFALRADGTKSSVYGDEMTEAAVEITLETVKNIDLGITPTPQSAMALQGQPRRAMKNTDRAIDFDAMDAETIHRIIRMSDSQPGARATLGGRAYRLYDAHFEDKLQADPGAFKATRDGAVLIGTRTRALWIGMAKEDATDAIKLPADRVLPIGTIPERPCQPWQLIEGSTFRDVTITRHGNVSVIHAAFYNGAMSVERSQRATVALQYAQNDPRTAVIVLSGSRNHFSNGIDLNTIQASPRPAHEAWQSINAINEIALSILRSKKPVITALSGNAGAGGVMVGLGADRVIARAGTVFNPHYKGMGLYGSELWTYSLPRRVGMSLAVELTEALLPVLAEDALEIGLVDAILPRDWDAFQANLVEYASALVPIADQLVKARLSALEMAAQPLEAHRATELSVMVGNMFGDDLGFKQKCAAFVLKTPQCGTPSAIQQLEVSARVARAAPVKIFAPDATRTPAFSS